MILLSLPLLALAILVRSTSPGSALFTQERVCARRLPARHPGEPERWELKTFTILKFRSMRADASQLLHVQHVALLTGGAAAGRQFKLVGDARITPFGHWLRRLSLDELPQLLNVLKGDMSLVGPRSLPVYEAVRLQPRHRLRFAARPGITGLWQTSGRGSLSYEQMLELDVDYVQHRSVKGDVALLLRTPSTVLRRTGAA